MKPIMEVKTVLLTAIAIGLLGCSKDDGPVTPPPIAPNTISTFNLLSAADNESDMDLSLIKSSS